MMSKMGDDEDALLEEEIRRELDALGEDDLEVQDIEVDESLGLPQTQEDAMPDTVNEFLKLVQTRNAVAEDELRECDQVLSQVPDINDLYLDNKQLAVKLQDTLGDEAEGDPLELRNKILSELEEEDINDEKEKLRADATDEIMALDIIRPDVIEEIKAQEAAAREKLFQWEEEQRKRDERRQALHEERRREEELRNEREQTLREQKQKELEKERQTFHTAQEDMAAKLQQMLKEGEERMELLHNQLKEDIKLLEKEKERESDNLTKMREEEARLIAERNNKAATNIQKHFRRMRVERQYKPILDTKREERRRKRKEELDTIERVEKKVREKAEQKKKEEEEKRKREREEKKLREEQEKKRRAEEEQRKQDEEKRRQEEEARKREEERVREEQEKKRKELEEQKRREEERRLEEERRRKEEESRRKEEEERKRLEEKRKQAEEQRKKEEEKEKLRIEEERKRKDEEEKQRVDELLQKIKREREEKEEKEKKFAEEKRKKEEEERRRMEAEKKRLEEEERMKEMAEKSRQEQETRLTHKSENYVSEDVSRKSVVANETSTSKGGSGLDSEAEQLLLEWIKQNQPWSPTPDNSKVKADVTTRSKPRRLLSASRHPQLTVDQILEASPADTSVHKVVQVRLRDLRSCNLQNLQQCPTLKYLSMDNCGVVALNGLDNCAQLQEIDMPNNKIELINNVNLSSLETLKLIDNNLTSVHGLERCKNLRSLNLKNNKITRLAGLQGCPLLKDLVLDNNQLIMMKGLASLRCLQTLSCVENHLTKVTDLEDCGLLSRLCLQGNNLHEPPSLTNHVLLKELYLDDNSISNLDPLSNAWLPSLQLLSLSQNSLSHLSSLKSLIILQTLDISNNIISDLDSLLPGLDGCLSLETLKLEGNPVNEEPECRTRILETVPSLTSIDDLEVPRTRLEGSRANDHSSSPYVLMCIRQTSERNTTEQKHQNNMKDYVSSEEKLSQEAVIKRLLVKSKHFKELYDMAVKHRRDHEEFTSRGGKAQIDKVIVETKTQAEVTTYTPVAPPDERSIRAPIPGQKTERVQRSSKKLTRDAAATKIQALWRGWYLRYQIDLQTKQWLAAVSIQAAWRGYSVWKDYQSLKALQSKLNTRPSPWQQHHHQAATKIQASYRGYLVRRRLHEALSSSRYKHRFEDDFDYDEEVDLSAFDFEDSALDSGWTPADTPMIPNRPPVLPTPPQQQKVTQESHNRSVEENLPWAARHAWRSAESPVTDAKPPLPHKPRVSPDHDHMSVTSAGRSSKQDELSHEWGFQNSGTAELMMKRAKRMKKKAKPKNAESRLALFKKLDESNKPLRDGTKVMQTNRKTPQRVDYFAAKEFLNTSPTPDSKAQMTYSWVYNQAVVHEDEEENLMSGQKDFACEGSPSPSKKPQGQAQSGSSQVSLPFMDRIMLSGRPVPLVTNSDVESNPQSSRPSAYAESGEARYYLPPIKSPSVPNLVAQGVPSPPEQTRDKEKSNSAGARISKDRKGRR